jgi:hypothetical protein
MKWRRDLSLGARSPMSRSPRGTRPHEERSNDVFTKGLRSDLGRIRPALVGSFTQPDGLASGNTWDRAGVSLAVCRNPGALFRRDAPRD